MCDHHKVADKPADLFMLHLFIQQKYTMPHSPTTRDLSAVRLTCTIRQRQGLNVDEAVCESVACGWTVIDMQLVDGVAHAILGWQSPSEPPVMKWEAGAFRYGKPDFRAVAPEYVERLQTL